MSAGIESPFYTALSTSAFLSGDESKEFNNSGSCIPEIHKHSRFKETCQQSLPIVFDSVHGNIVLNTNPLQTLDDLSLEYLAGSRKLQNHQGLTPRLRCNSLEDPGICSTTLTSNTSFRTYPTGIIRRASEQVQSNKPGKRFRRGSMPSLPSASFFPLKPIKSENLQRTIKFQSPFSPKPRQLHGLRSPHPLRLSNTTNTDALASLAWTGELPSPTSSSGYALSSIGPTFLAPKLGIGNAEIIRRSTWSGVREGRLLSTTHQATFMSKSPINSSKIEHSKPGRDKISSKSRRRWTLAMAITDESITDEMLVKGLEEVRCGGTDYKRNASSSKSPLDDSTRPDIENKVESPLPESEENLPSQPFSYSFLPSPVSLGTTWQAARRALLLCREFVHTERHYVMSLQALLSCEMTTPPPPSMIPYFSALHRASGEFLAKLERNPSVRGVSEAFLEAEKQLESAFVSWSGMVGQFFIAELRCVGVKRSISMSNEYSNPARLRKYVKSWTKRLQRAPNISDINFSGPIPQYEKAPSINKSNLNLRDLAILPTQRITRYVLLFKELHSITPSTLLSCTSIEKAMHSAISIANKANEAQINIAFIH